MGSKEDGGEVRDEEVKVEGKRRMRGWNDELRKVENILKSNVKKVEMRNGRRRRGGK